MEIRMVTFRKIRKKINVTTVTVLGTTRVSAINLRVTIANV